MTLALRKIAGNVQDPRTLVFRIIDKKGLVISTPVEGLGLVEEFPMLLNPKAFSIKMEQLVNPVRTKGGYIVYHWGHRPDTITASGNTPAYYVSEKDLIRLGKGDFLTPGREVELANQKGLSGADRDKFIKANSDLHHLGAFPSVGSTGLSRTYRNETEGFRHYKKLVEIYRNNGVKKFSSGLPVPGGEGFIEMQYQNMLYRGHFLSFNERETVEQPFSMEYDFVFKVRQEVTTMVQMRQLFSEVPRQ